LHPAIGCSPLLFAPSLHILPHRTLTTAPCHLTKMPLCPLSVCAASATITSMSKPSAPSETLGEAPPPTWISEWLKRTPSRAPPDYPTTNMELCDPVGKQFKRKHLRQAHEECVVCRLDTVTKDQHEDLILCEAVIEFDENEFEAYAFEVDKPPASASLIHSPLARRRAGQRCGCARDCAQLAHRAHHASRAR
jgi:hypothetical protein